MAAAPAAKPSPGLTGNGGNGNSGADKKNDFEVFPAVAKPELRWSSNLLRKFAFEESLTGEHEYIIQFIEQTASHVFLESQ